MIIEENKKNQEVKDFQPSFNRQQLIEMSKQEIYKWLATSHQLVLRDKIMKEDESKLCMRLLREQREELLYYTRKLQLMFSEQLLSLSGMVKLAYEEAINIVKSEELNQIKSNIQSQKELYKKEENIFNSRIAIDIPLNRKWNDLYDDMSITCLFYDGISAFNTDGKLEQYESIIDNKERMEFVKNNIEITHIAIQATTNDDVFCELLGDTVYIPETQQTVAYPGELLDFNNLTLQDTMSISNQDVRQFIQSKMNLDKEPLKIIDEQDIRGSVYTLKKHIETNREYVRFECPSTKRVYYAEIDRHNFENSKYYDKNDITTVLRAWWSLTHLNANPLSKRILPRV